MAEPLAALTGRVRLHIGRGLPAIDSSRSELAARLAPGQPADALPGLLGTLFTLCATAHRSCAERAVQAARGAAAAPTPAQREGLRLATLRDQVQRIVHDWPRQLQPGTEDPLQTALQLRHCPLWREALTPAERVQELPAWLAHRWLGEAPAAWLARLQADPLDGTAEWARRQPGTLPLARLLQRLLAQQPSPLTLAVPDAPLKPGLDDFGALATAMAETPGFCLQPTLQGPRSSGPWSRLADGPLPATAWHLLIARIADVLQLADPSGAERLAQGALALPGHAGLAWCEMARGLLVHWVRLSADGRQVEACRVLAPTEWNFHPHGVLAQALAGLDAGRTPAQRLAAARCLAVAFDPCVDFTLHLADTGTVVPHEVRSDA
jgi:hypothetical protein